MVAYVWSPMPLSVGLSHIASYNTCILPLEASGFEGRIWDLIVSVPVHCLSFYFSGHIRCIMV